MEDTLEDMTDIPDTRDIPADGTEWTEEDYINSIIDYRESILELSELISR